MHCFIKSHHRVKTPSNTTQPHYAIHWARVQSFFFELVHSVRVTLRVLIPFLSSFFQDLAQTAKLQKLVHFGFYTIEV